MPNRTLYVKDSDVSLFEQAQEQLGESISSMFAEFLRERVGNAAPDAGRITGLIERIEEERQAVKKDKNLPRFLAEEYAEAQEHAERALKAFRREEIARAKACYWAAGAYRDKAERDVKEVRQLAAKIEEMLETA